MGAGGRSLSPAAKYLNSLQEQFKFKYVLGKGVTNHLFCARESLATESKNSPPVHKEVATDAWHDDRGVRVPNISSRLLALHSPPKTRVSRKGGSATRRGIPNLGASRKIL